MEFNYMREAQAITDDFNKASLVVESVNYLNQLPIAINYCQQLVKYHCGRLGLNKRFESKLYWLLKEKNKKEKNKLIEYIDLCVAALQDKVDIKKEEAKPYFEHEAIGYSSAETKSLRTIQSDIKKWDEKKIKDNKDVYRITECEKLQID